MYDSESKSAAHPGAFIIVSAANQRKEIGPASEKVGMGKFKKLRVAFPALEAVKTKLPREASDISVFEKLRAVRKCVKLSSVRCRVEATLCCTQTYPRENFFLEDRYFFYYE